MVSVGRASARLSLRTTATLCVLVLIGAGACDRGVSLQLIVEPTNEVVYKIAEGHGFESWLFGLTWNGRSPNARIDELRIDYLADGVLVEQMIYGEAALRAHRIESSSGATSVRDLQAMMPSALGVDAMVLRAYVAGRPVGERRVRLARYAQQNRYLLPVRGCWFVSSGHDFGGEHRRWYNRAHFGWDLVLVDAEGDPAKDPADGLDAYYAYGQQIFSPADGTVEMTAGGFPDNPPGSVGANERANYLLINHGGGEFLKLAHLAQGSLAVQPGDRVHAGQLLGRVGNSGMSDAPHLHVHFQTTTFENGVLVDGDPLPINFSGYSVTSNRGVRRPVAGGRPRRGEFICTDGSAVEPEAGQ